MHLEAGAQKSPFGRAVMERKGPLAPTRVRCIDTAKYTSSQIACDAGLLNNEERAVFRQFVDEKDRRDYAAAHALLRTMLSEGNPEVAPDEWRFARTDLGKPYLPFGLHQALHFSISHTRGFVACTTSLQGSVGVDVECGLRTTEIDPLIMDVCSTDERTQIAAAAPNERRSLFLDLWTLKESYLKACGLGLSMAPNTLSFDLREPGRISGPLFMPVQDAWRQMLFRPNPTSRMAVTIQCAAAPVLDVTLIDAAGLRVLHPDRTT
ncbi:4'-phosphopantetheinyl transferase family protein [Roseomonas mucosa]|uniref:4'-phosphopantetheinyl transferase family protein n=1 Tax=Roseomonas mucosa TaxID=207340 RepID=UPI0022458961|nr:4'-phosphopantetheinyl transferase superfamily protein [Roseomonas mucosa]